MRDTNCISADPDLELRGGPVLIYLPWRPFSLQSFLLFLPKIRGGGGGGAGPQALSLDPPLCMTDQEKKTLSISDYAWNHGCIINSLLALSGDEVYRCESLH